MWSVALPIVLAVISLMGTVGSAVTVARFTSADKSKDRQSGDIWRFVDELQEELQQLRNEVKDLRAAREQDQRTIQALTLDNARLTARVEALRHKTADDRRD